MVGRQTFHFEMPPFLAPFFREHWFIFRGVIFWYVFDNTVECFANLPDFPQNRLRSACQQKGWKLPGSTVTRQMHLAAMRELVAATSQQIHEREAVPWQITWMPTCGEDDWFTGASRFERWLKFLNPGYKYKFKWIQCQNFTRKV